MRRLFAFALTTVAMTGIAAASPKLAPDLDGHRRGTSVDVIVQFKTSPGAKSHAAIQSRGGTLHATLPLVRAASYSLPFDALEALAADPNVAYVSPDRPVAATLDYATRAAQADLASISYGLDGTGIGVAVIDSGIADIPDLHTPSYRVVYSQTFVKGKEVKDTYGHGTHVAGILAGNGKNSTGSGYLRTFKGMAPGVSIVSLRVLDGTGQGTESSVIAAIQKAVALKSTYNLRVINLSLGRRVHESFKTDPLCQAVEAAWKAGIVVVVAAGNEGRDDSMGTDGYGTIGSPANDPYVITVGATKTLRTLGRSDDIVASYSSKGPTSIDHIVKPDLVASGNRVVSLYKAGFTLSNLHPENGVAYGYYKVGGNTTASSTYFTLSGTSMSAPLVSGAVALMLQKTPSLTPDQVKARLMKTAYKAFPPLSTTLDPVTGAVYTTHHDVFTMGAGALDLLAALQNQELFVGRALSPTAIYDGHAHGPPRLHRARGHRRDGGLG